MPPRVTGSRPQRTTRRKPPTGATFAPTATQQFITGSPFKPYEPYQTPPVPAGYYDPALDAARDAAGRGLEDLQYDTTLGMTRLGSDLTLGKEQIGQESRRGKEDLFRQQGVLNRAYQTQANRQGQQINAAGVGLGGASLQAAAKRAANQAFDQQPIDTARTRLGEDTTGAYKRLGLGYERATQDLGLGLVRAQREDTQFGIDTDEQKAFQASQAGYVPPAPPANEFTENGETYRVKDRGRVRYRVSPDGSILGSRFKNPDSTYTNPRKKKGKGRG